MTSRTQELHAALRFFYPKDGRCEECGATDRPTVWAYQRHPEPHTLDRNDYREQCRSCHAKLDNLMRRIRVRTS